MEQDAITFLLAEKAREGKLVARLKRGDPFVFDRGGEEALFLHAQGIPFEVVPGIPLGIGVPAYAGVPVTYPGGGDTITLVRGYEDDNRVLPMWTGQAWPSSMAPSSVTSDRSNCPGSSTSSSPMIGRQTGRPSIVYNGTLPSQTTVSGTIAELAEQVREHPRRDPAIVVVGRVVAFRNHLRWFDARPLFGKRVLVTRPRDQAAEMVDRLSVMGAEAIEAPMIRIAPPEDLGPLRRAVDNAEDFDWIVFTSANAVEAFMSAVARRHARRPVAEGTAPLQRRQRHCRTPGAIRRQGRPHPRASSAGESLVVAMADTRVARRLPRSRAAGRHRSGRHRSKDCARPGHWSPTSSHIGRSSKTLSRTTVRTSTACCSTMRSTS